MSFLWQKKKLTQLVMDIMKKKCFKVLCNSILYYHSIQWCQIHDNVFTESELLGVEIRIGVFLGKVERIKVKMSYCIILKTTLKKENNQTNMIRFIPPLQPPLGLRFGGGGGGVGGEEGWCLSDKLFDISRYLRYKYLKLDE